MTFHEFIFTSSIVMAPDLKIRPKTDGRGMTVHPSLNHLRYTVQLSKKRAPWRLFSGNVGLMCPTSAVL